MKMVVTVGKPMLDVDGGLRKIVVHTEWKTVKTIGLRSRLLRRLRTKELRELLESGLQEREALEFIRKGTQSPEPTTRPTV